MKQVTALFLTVVFLLTMTIPASSLEARIKVNHHGKSQTIMQGHHSEEPNPSPHSHTKNQPQGHHGNQAEMGCCHHVPQLGRNKSFSFANYLPLFNSSKLNFSYHFHSPKDPIIAIVSPPG